MSGMSEFFIKDRAGKGAKLPLTIDGDKTDHYVLVRGKDSDEYRQATAESVIRGRDVMLSESSISERAKALIDERYKVLSSLISGWSFDEDVTAQSAYEFVSSVPDSISQAMDGLANDRAKYLKKP